MRAVAQQYAPQMAQMQFRATNWKGVLYTLLVVTRKFWNDNNYWNADVFEPTVGLEVRARQRSFWLPARKVDICTRLHCER